MTSPIPKYLAHYASAEVALVRGPEPLAALEQAYDAALVIPACDEVPEFVGGVAAACRAGPGRVLCIAVVNGSPALEEPARERNQRLLAGLWEAAPGRGQARARGAGFPAAWVGDAGGFNLLVIDRASPTRELAVPEGVGGARRIGCDVALALAGAGRLTSSWLHTSDADVSLPLDYFARARAGKHQEKSALVYPFWHVGASGGAVSPALGLYELSLRHYFFGMAQARRRFAFHTLGSALAVDVDTYAAVRGVPRRRAGEDFYLLNKAAKIGSVAIDGGAPIEIRERPSARVPFGTGPGTARMAAELAAGEEPRFYHPAVFQLVRAAAIGIEAFAESGDIDRFRAACRDQAAATGVDAHADLLDHVFITPRLVATLEEARDRTNSPPALARRLDDWFDGFRILKLVHALRDNGVASIPWPDAMVAMGFAGTRPGIEDVEALRQHLFERERMYAR